MAARKSFGTLLKRETTPASGTYTTLGGLTGLNLPAIQIEVADSTHMESAGAFREKTPTLGSLGDVTSDIHYDSSDATQEQLTADAIDMTIRNYQIVVTDAGAAVWTFAAYVTNFAPSHSLDGLNVASLTLTPTGLVTRA
jgi:predicted secreted protein